MRIDSCISYKAMRLKRNCLQPIFGSIVILFACSITYCVHAGEEYYGSEEMRDFYPIDVTPIIEVKEGVVTSRLVFINRSDSPVLVMEGVNGFGVRGSAIRDPQPLVDNEFTISVNGTKIRYIGPVYKRMPYTKNYFSKMLSHEVINVRYNRLDLAYEFVHGTHEYEIVHHHLEYDEKAEKIIQVDSRPVKFVYTRR